VIQVQGLLLVDGRTKREPFESFSPNIILVNRKFESRTDAALISLSCDFCCFKI